VGVVVVVAAAGVGNAEVIVPFKDGADVMRLGCEVWVVVGIEVEANKSPTKESLEASDSKACTSAEIDEFAQRFRINVKIFSTEDAPDNPFPSSILVEIIHCWQAAQLIMKSEFATHDVFWL